MRRAIVASCFALVACNATFRLDKTQLTDAPGPDAPAACPSLDTAPTFDAHLTQFLTRNCTAFMTAERAQRASAYCGDAGRNSVVAGPIGGALEPVLPEPINVVRSLPRLSPEGDELWIHEVQQVGAASSVEIYRETGAGWEHAYALPLVRQAASTEPVTAPTARAFGPRRFLLLSQTPFGMQEWVEQGATWQLFRSITYDQLGVLIGSSPQLSEDGLRFFFNGTRANESFPHPMYAWRSSVTDPFGIAIDIPTAPKRTYDSFVTPDCGRLYVTGLGSIFFARQL